MPAKPTGTVAFLFSDIEGSTRLWELYPKQMERAFARQEFILRQAIAETGGHPYKMIGDAFQVAFNTASQAVECALLSQKRLHAEPWIDQFNLPTPLKVRMALHCGVTEERADDYVGPALNRVARVLATGYGGQVLLTQAIADLIIDQLPPGASLRDLGEHRLKDLVRAEHIYQLIVPELPSEFPPIKSLSAFRHNLPEQLTTFIGRQKEIQEIKPLLLSPHSRLVTLTGSGGTGKTRLAIQVAAEVIDHFQDGVWLVELAPLADPERVTQAVAQALSVGSASKNPAASLVDYLRTKQALLILDNCEHVVEAVAQLCDTLLRACPDLHILATSREIIGAQGELPYRVPSLRVPDSRHLPDLEALSAYDAVRLFVERARLVDARFRLTAENAGAVSQICQRLDGIPLALELAAARSRVLSVDQIAMRLDDAFRLLTGGSRTVMPRHQTLKALIDWSYALLTDAEKTLLIRLAVFAGGWSLEAAETVCSDQKEHTHTGITEPTAPPNTQSMLNRDEILTILAQLVDKSLVLVDQSHSDQVRYHFLETIRQYARDRLLESGQSKEMRDRHLAYYEQLVIRAEPNLRQYHSAKLLECMEIELDNLRAALEWSLSSNLDAGLRIAALLLWFWHIRNHSREGLEWLERLLKAEKAASYDQSPDLARKIVSTEAMITQGVLCVFHDSDLAPAILAECKQRALELGPAGLRSLAISLLYLTSFHSHESAISDLQQSLAIFRQEGDQIFVAENLSFLGDAYGNLGDLDRARQYYNESLDLRRTIKDRDGEGTVLFKLGDIAVIEGRLEQARLHYEESLSCYREVNNIRFIVNDLFRLANLARLEGNISKMSQKSEEAMQVVMETGDKGLIALSLFQLGLSTWDSSDPAAAVHLREALGLAREIQDVPTVATILYGLGLIAWSSGDSELAVRQFNESLAAAEQAGVQPLCTNALMGLGMAYTSLGKFDAAENYFKKGLAQAVKESNRLRIAMILEGIAYSLSGRGQYELAIRLFCLSTKESNQLGNYVPTAIQAFREEELLKLRNKLGETDFERFWNSGMNLSLDEAVNLVQANLSFYPINK